MEDWIELSVWVWLATLGLVLWTVFLSYPYFDCGFWLLTFFWVCWASSLTALSFRCLRD